MHSKGFPDSYDVRALLQFLAAVKAGQRQVAVPTYSHITYDIQPDEFTIVDQPDVLIVEGLNILQAAARPPGPRPQVFASDFFDFTIYIDADTALIRSEERRVGKEGRSRWAPYHQKKQQNAEKHST